MGSMFADPSSYEFAPGDIEMFVKWLGWMTPADHLNNDTDLLDREQWYWVSGEALEALKESVWDQPPGGGVPILEPADLPSPDGIMLLANPLHLDARPVRRRERRMDGEASLDPEGLENFAAVRWTARSSHVVVQAVFGTSMLAVMRLEDPGLQLGDLIYRPPPEGMLQPGAWRHQEGLPMEGRLRCAARSAPDGSPLLVVFQEPRVWQWGRRSRPITEDPGAEYWTGLMNDALDTAIGRLPEDALRSVDVGLAAVAEKDTPEAASLRWALGTIAAEDQGEAAVAAFMADVGQIATRQPILSTVPPVGGFIHHVPAEMVDLPDEDEMRDLVAQKPLGCAPHDAQMARLLHCLWSFASLPLPASTPRRVMRDVPKHRRHGRRRGGLRVLTLREEPAEGGSDTGSGRARPRRHLVRGHWRNQRYPSLGTRRLKWIAPHLRAGNPNDPASEGPRTVRRVPGPA